MVAVPLVYVEVLRVPVESLYSQFPGVWVSQVIKDDPVTPVNLILINVSATMLAGITDAQVK
jgi:hypothetical protein